MKILLVCLGNICRSPLAEGILQQQAAEAGLAWQIDSAGTNGIHTGEAPHLLSQKVAKKNGIDISHQVSRPFVAADFKIYDHIFAMSNDVMADIKKIAGTHFDHHKASLFLNELYPGEDLDVTDPWYGGEEGYDEVFTQIQLTCAALVANHTGIQPAKLKA